MDSNSPTSPLTIALGAQVLRGGLAGWQMKTILCLANNDLGGLTVGSMAAAAKLSPHHFSRAFRISFGASPRDWILGQKMAAACKRLASGHDPVALIAADLGYGASSQFCRAFRAHLGVSPETFRRA